jgi:hypothetical protein
MNNFIKDNWFKISLLMIIIVSTCVVFYWYSYRPTQIIKMCAEKKEQCAGFGIANLGKYCSKIEKEIIYNDCLKKNGLEK